MIRQILQMLIILLIGTNNGPVNDLRKKPTREDHLKSMNCIFQKYFYLWIALFMTGVFIVFVLVCVTFVGASGVESGAYYYHLDKVI